MNDNKDKKERIRRFTRGKGPLFVLLGCALTIALASWIVSASLDDPVEKISASVVLTPSMPDSASSVPGAASLPSPRTDAVPPVTSAPQTPAPTAPAETSPTPSAAASPAMTLPETAEPVSALPAALVRPVAGTLETPFSVDELIYSRTMADWRIHTGADYSAPLGTKVIAAADGIVSAIYDDVMLGTTVVIDHGGSLSGIYSNLAALPAVSVGDRVKLGDTIGSVGCTSMAEAADICHLHFEMTLNGERVDPEDFFSVSAR